MTNWDLFLECKDVPTYENKAIYHINRMKGKKPHDHLVDAEKALDKVVTTFYDKNNTLEEKETTLT